jgi:hypothetical protein
MADVNVRFRWPPRLHRGRQVLCANLDAEKIGQILTPDDLALRWGQKILRPVNKRHAHPTGRAETAGDKNRETLSSPSSDRRGQRSLGLFPSGRSKCALPPAKSPRS